MENSAESSTRAPLDPASKYAVHALSKAWTNMGTFSFLSLAGAMSTSGTLFFERSLFLLTALCREMNLLASSPSRWTSKKPFHTPKRSLPTPQTPKPIMACAPALRLLDLLRLFQIELDAQKRIGRGLILGFDGKLISTLLLMAHDHLILTTLGRHPQQARM